MGKGTLSERLEDAILGLVTGTHGSARTLQHSWGDWESAVRNLAPDVTQPDLNSAFKRLRNRGIVKLWKPDSERRNAYQYSGNDADDTAFFYTGPFNVDMTDEGVSYWESIRMNSTGNPIGFVHPR